MYNRADYCKSKRVSKNRDCIDNTSHVHRNGEQGLSPCFVLNNHIIALSLPRPVAAKGSHLHFNDVLI